MKKSVIVNSVEAFLQQGTGIKTFSRNLISALAGGGSRRIQLLISTSSNRPNHPIASSNILQQQRKLGRLDKLVETVGVKLSSLLELRLFSSSAVTKEVGIDDPLRKPFLEKTFADSFFADPGLDTATSCHDVSEHGFIYAKQVFKSAPMRFKFGRRLTCLRLPKNSGIISRGLVYHSPLPYPIVVRGCPNICTIHDIIPITRPDLCLDDPEYFYDLVTALLQGCDAIHCISNHTASGIRQYFGSKNAAKLFVAHQPIGLAHVTPQFEARSLGELRARYERSYERDRYILQVGSIEPKKNHQITIEAFRLLREEYPTLKLVILGKQGWLSKDLCGYLSSASSEGVQWVRAASYGALMNYFCHASAVVFPSVVEGWGLPPLEAMSFGAPVVAAPIEPCKEALGDAPLYMDDANDAWSLAQHLRAILADPDLASQMASKGFSRAKAYSHAAFAARLSQEYAKISS
jgi:glycosyltransferase involved in cell wall biosynthesis